MSADVRDRLHREVRAVEPPFTLDREQVIHRGRRHVRARRLAVGAVGAAMAAVLAFGVAYLMQQGGSSGPEIARKTGRDALSRALASYDPQRMPGFLESRARAALGDGVDLGPARFVAGDAGFRRLPPAEYSDADYMYVQFGGPTVHNVKLFVGHANDQPASTENSCAGLANGTLMSCETATAPDGGTMMTITFAAKEVPKIGPGMYQQVDYRKLTAKDLASVRVEREVRVTHPGGYLTTVTEQVFGPNGLDQASIFDVPISDMTTLATDPALVIPKPGS